MNSYEKKQQAKKERYEERARKAEAEAQAELRRSRQATEHIPLGQPILVGHHSEGMHRAAIRRSDRAMKRSVDSSNKAAHYAAKAAGVGKGGISSDDPDAVEKLRAKLARREESREKMKAANKAHKRGGWEAVVEAGYLTEKQADQMRSLLAQDRPFPPYALQNAGSEIRRLKKRIQELEARAEAAKERAGDPQTVEGEGFRIEEAPEENRLRIFFDEKPTIDMRKKLKAHGFRWAPSVGAWQRHLSVGAWYSARSVLGVG